ncbi:ubiquitin conjugating enzyme [Entophlyctis helioformis]|nr:ubiquitin conjugating enzyme [Entophlyctis helioformis]
MSNATILRLQQEFSDMAKGSEHQILIEHSDEDIKHIHALIMGPINTPYCLGFFDFTIECGNNYPTEPPKVTARTTAHGTTRFNPNIYSCGKVCLSLLGTWRGDPCEQWSAVQGLAGLCVSIQSLMTDMPYRNEPGFDNENNKTLLETYNQKITHETLRISICDRFENMLDANARKAVFCRCSGESPFADQMKLMFLWYFDVYMSIVDRESPLVKNGQKFMVARFEGSGNIMNGTFDYSSIRKRLISIHDRILDESNHWLSMAPKNIQDDLLIVGNLKKQFDQIVASQDYDSTMSMELVDGNPFHWRMVIIGPLGTNYEDGLFEVRMVFHKSFPAVPPRIRFETSVFHASVAPNGVPYYKVAKPGDVRQYLDALYALFSEPPSSSPATHLNTQAAQLYFGDETQRRSYNRSARRCAQRSVD